MSGPELAGPSVWSEAALAASLFAVDPVGTGGVCLRALPGPARDRWLALLGELLPPELPMRRVPLHVGDGRLLGGLDLAATLEAGRPVAERGILADADGGIVLLAMAERLSRGTAARLGAVLDTGEVLLEREGFTQRLPARFGVVALDEGIAPDERPPPALRDRLAFHLDLATVPARGALGCEFGRGAVGAARARLLGVGVSAKAVEALTAAAAALGIASLRAPWLAVQAARVAAALAGRDRVAEEDCAVAARLVLAPRATVVPLDEPAEEEPPPEEQAPPEAESDAEDPPLPDPEALTDLLVAAAQAAIPPGLLETLRTAAGSRSRSPHSGGAGARRNAVLRGRPAGVRRGESRAGGRLSVIETLRAAAPWQRLRRSEPGAAGGARVRVRREDFRITRFRHRAETTAIFAVDASGSTALQRLAEAKGAVELLLGECYVRRDRVALVAFRGDTAELLLPPTTSLARAKRTLAALPGGGATPLCAGIEAATELADAVLRRGGTPLLLFLTDGRANIARDGTPGRARADEDAIGASRLVRAAGVGALVVDTSPRPQPKAAQLAREMGARYVPLPHADATTLFAAVRETAAGAERAGEPRP